MALAIKKQQQVAFPKKRAPKKPEYLSWLHSLPSCVSGEFGAEAAHLSYASPMHGHFGRSKGTKAPDIFALPLTPAEHRRSHSMNERDFWEETGIQPHQTALTLFALWSMYDEQEATERACARIYGGIAKANKDEMPW